MVTKRFVFEQIRSGSFQHKLEISVDSNNPPSVCPQSPHPHVNFQFAKWREGCLKVLKIKI